MDDLQAMRASRQRTLWAILGLGLAALAPPLAAEIEPTAEDTARERPRIGLVLGGGGARGGAHIGALTVLEELRIPIDCIAGTSMGALVGATYATGAPLSRIEREILNVNWAATIGSEGQRALVPMQQKLAGITYSNNLEFSLTSSGLQGAGGLVSTQNIEGFFRLLIGDARDIRDFDELAIPFRAVATDLAASEMVVIGSGDLTRAMRASMAVPGVFSPVIIDDKVLADGGMMRNLPVDVARELCADVVIAVSLEAPPPQADQLRSVFALAGRSIDAMIIANERQQLASLGADDVAIIVPTGDLGSSQFNRVPETIPLGVAAARKAAATLARYSVTEEEYRAWRAGLNRPEPVEVKVEAVRFAPLRRASADFLATRLGIGPGETVSLATLEYEMRKVFAAGDFIRVDYQLLPGKEGGKIVEIHAVERPGGTDFVRFDLGLAGSSGGDTRFVIRADHRREWVNPLGGQWRNAFQLGTLSELETAFYQPLDVPQRFYVEPGFILRRTIEDFFDDGDRAARYDLLEAVASFDAGVNLGNHGRVSAGLRWGAHEYDEDIGGVPGFDPERRRDSNIRLGAIYDTRDAAALPTSGIYGQLDFTSSGSWLGGEESYDVIEGVLSRSTAWREGTLLVAGGAGRRVGGDLPRHRDFRLGGVRSFPAFAPGELRGEKYWSVSADWVRRLVEFSPVFQQVLFGGFGLEAARMTDRVDGVSEGVILGASLNIGARTPVGPLLVSVGFADNSNVTVHFALGRPIPEGSLLDRLH
jgi:NTE family protein